MAREGSVTDPKARRAVGQSVGEQPTAEEIQNTGDEPRARKSQSRDTRRQARDDTRDTRRRTPPNPNARQEAALERDRALLRGGHDDGDGHELTDEPAPRAARKQPARARRTPTELEPDKDGQIQFRGKKFKTVDELEDYLDDLEVEAANSRRSPRNDNTERPTPKTKEKKKFEVGDDRAFFEKPGDVFNKFAEFIEERMVEAFNEHIAPTINGQSAVREFWRDFYQENPEFNDKRWKRLIESTFSENMDKLGDLTPDRARDRLARILKRDFQEMGIQLKKGRAAAEEDDDQEEEELLEHRTSVEGGQARRSRASGQEEQEERPQTLTDLMRARKNARLMIRQEERA